MIPAPTRTTVAQFGAPFKRRALVMLAAFAAIPMSACGRPDATPAEVAIGKPIPPYSAATLDGATRSIADQKGKVVLLNVWATWCAPCRDEIPYLQSLYDRHAANGLEVIGVSVDARGSEETIREFSKDFRMTYPIWLDPDEKVQTLYMALGVPASYLIDRGGVLRWKHLGTVRATDTSFTNALDAALGSGTP
ncbi:MAG: TlpA family protein disulfide reductase [Gemmatimonadaceae bacterium]|nr:TlpA family protein disulfide reductase [Gemmatimonadaceae bacterium]